MPENERNMTAREGPQDIGAPKKAPSAEGIAKSFDQMMPCELPSPKGEGFKLRLKPVRVGLTADCLTRP